MATTQAEFQRQLDAAAWRNVIVNVPEGGVDVYDEPLKAHGCVIAGRLPFATPHPVRGRADIRLHASARPGVLLKGPGAGLFNCLIDYPDNGTDFPLPAPPAVRAISGGVCIRDVVLYGAYDGLRLEDAGHTEVIAQRLMGGPHQLTHRHQIVRAQRSGEGVGQIAAHQSASRAEIVKRC